MVLLTLAGCAADLSSSPPEPLELVPAEGSGEAPAPVIIRGRGFSVRVVTDFGERSGSRVEGAFSARLGAFPLREVTLAGAEELTAVVPQDLPPGSYDLTVIDPSGRTGTLPGAYRVRASSTITPLQISRMLVEVPAGPQRASLPFTASVSALDTAGAPLEAFSGPVQLGDLSGTLRPREILLRAGRWSGPVEIDAAHPADVLRASRDAVSGESAPFVVTPAASALRFATPPRTVASSLCSAEVIVEQVDPQGFPVIARGPTPVLLSAEVGLSLFSDAACTVPLDAQLDAGRSSLSFHFSAAVARRFTITASTAGLVTAAQQEWVAPGGPAKLRLLTAPQILVAGACSSVVVAQLEDLSGNVSPAASATTLALGAPAGSSFDFYSDASCATAIAAAPIAGGASAAFFFLRGTKVGQIGITATSASLSATQSEKVIAAPADRLVFTSPARTAVAGDCSAVVTLEPRDPFGNHAEVPAGAALSFSGAPKAGFGTFLDATCATPVSSVTFDAQGVASIFVRGTASGTVTLSATLGGLPVATQPVIISPAPAVRLAFATVAQAMTAGVCSRVATVEGRDSFDNPAPPPSPGTPTVTPGTGLSLFADALCTKPLSTLAFAGGASSSFYMRASLTGSFAVKISSGTLLSTTQTETVASAPPDHVAFVTPSRSAVAGTCSPVLTVEARDPFNNPSAPAVGTSLALSAVPSTGFSFFSDAACSVGVASVPFDASALARFHFRGTVAGTTDVTVKLGLFPALVQPETVSPAAAKTLAITSAAQALTAGRCSRAITVDSRDAFGNLSAPGAAATPAASPSAGVGFFSDAACNTPLTSLDFAGSPVAQLFMKARAAGSVDLTLSSGALSPATQTETVGAAPPDHLAFVTPARTAIAGFCSAVVTVESRDAFDNPSPLAAGASLSLSANPSAKLRFSTDSTCTTTATSAPFAGSRADLRFLGTGAGQVVVTASAGGFSAAQTETVIPGEAASLTFDPIASPQPPGLDIAIRLTARDSYGNLATGFTGIAALTITPIGSVACSASCSAGTDTAAFVGGVWSGTVLLSGVATNIRLGANALAGTISGLSNPFELATSRFSEGALLPDPLGDGARFFFTFGYRGKIYFGPSKTGTGAERSNLNGSVPEHVSFSFGKDTNFLSGSTSRNAAAAPLPSIGATGCSPNTSSCGPDNENGRGMFRSGVTTGTEWLAIGGANSAGARYLYLSQSAGTTAAMTYVDLTSVVDSAARGFSAMHFFNDRLYVGLPSSGATSPNAMVLLRLPAAGAAGLDPLGAASGCIPLLNDLCGLTAAQLPGVGAAGTPANLSPTSMIDFFADFNDRLYLGNNGGLVRSTNNAPLDAQSNPTDWTSITPTAAAYPAKTSLTTAKAADLEPGDRTFTPMVVFNGHPFLGRNTTAGPQLWRCDPAVVSGPSPATAGDCDAGDWTLVAGNTAGDQLSQFDNASNTRITLLAVSGQHLYVGYDNAAQGVVVFRSQAALPGAATDFEGESACVATSAGCRGIGGNGFGQPSRNVRFFDFTTQSVSGTGYLYVTVGNGSTPARIYRQLD